MKSRLGLCALISLLVLSVLALTACQAERPSAPLGSPTAAVSQTPAKGGATPGTTPAAAVTRVALPTASGAATARPTAAGQTAPTRLTPQPASPTTKPAAATEEPASSTQTSSGDWSYTVVKGDTLNKIAVKFGTTAKAIQAANPSLKNPDAIYPGQELVIPGEAPPGYDTQDWYIIQSGDTLTSIAKQFGVTRAALQELNNITNPDLISVGDKLRIPRE